VFSFNRTDSNPFAYDNIHDKLRAADISANSEYDKNIFTLNYPPEPDRPRHPAPDKGAPPGCTEESLSNTPLLQYKSLL